jgi:DNA (cytosine-5)-methyltransferase 1
MEGERSSLITEAIRLVHECRPRVFIWENVKGTFSSNDGADFWAIIQAFANIGGYRCEWQLCNTKWFLPQNRERIYLVGYLAETRGDWRGVFPIGESDGENTAKRPVGYEIGDYRSDEGWRPRKNNNCPTLAARAREDGSGQPLLKVKSTTSKEAVVEPKIIGYTRDAKGKVTDRHLKDEAGTIHSSSGGGGNTDQFVQDVKVGTWRTHKDGQGFREVKGGNCPTIPARAREDGSGQPVIETSYRIRRLTPIECERLQGFPDNHTEYGNYDGEVKKMSNTQRYKQCGNAVTVDVVQAIANKLHPLFQ